jgi:hypothetical protein
MAESTYDALKNRGSNVDAQVDAAVNGPAAPAAKPVPVRSTTNPDNNLPDNDSVFHKVARGFGTVKSVFSGGNPKLDK